MQVEATMYFPVAVDELSMSSGSAIAGATKRSGLRLWKVPPRLSCHDKLLHALAES
ncbi:hypothetical protein YC2023_062439 [Brassica napus]